MLNEYLSFHPLLLHVLVVGDIGEQLSSKIRIHENALQFRRIEDLRISTLLQKMESWMRTEMNLFFSQTERENVSFETPFRPFDVDVSSQDHDGSYSRRFDIPVENSLGDFSVREWGLQFWFGLLLFFSLSYKCKKYGLF